MRIAVLLCPLVIGAATARSHAQPLTFQTVDAPNVAGVQDTELLGVNNHGALVGVVYGGSNSAAGTAFTSKPPYTMFEPISVPGAASTVVTGINSVGLICGYYSVPNGGPVYTYPSYGFVRTFGHGHYQYVKVADATGSYSVLQGFTDATHAFGLSADGSHFVYDIATGAFAPFRINVGPALQYSVAVGAINRLGVGVGTVSSTIDGETNGVVFSLGSSTPIAGIGDGYYTTLSGINNRGQVVGNYIYNPVSANNKPHGLVYTPSKGNYSALDVDGNSTVLTAINDADQAVGFYTDAAGTHGVVVSGLRPNYRR